MFVFHRISSVSTLPDYELSVRFLDGTTKVYDLKPLFEKWEQFLAIKPVAIFNSVQVDRGGYGISWNDEVDLSSEELWENGRLDTE